MLKHVFIPALLAGTLALSPALAQTTPAAPSDTTAPAATSDQTAPPAPMKKKMHKKKSHKKSTHKKRMKKTAAPTDNSAAPAAPAAPAQ